MYRLGATLLVSIFVLCSAADAASPGAPLIVTEPAGIERTNQPASGGVPVHALHVKSANDLVVVDESGKRVPAQISPMVTLEGGELAWVLVDLLTDLKPNETKKFVVRVQNNAPPAATKHPVVADIAADTITLTNGSVKLAMSKKAFNLFENVWLGGRAMLADIQPPALAIVRGEDGRLYTTRDGTVEGVTLEDSGPLRTTVRIDGVFGAAPSTQPEGNDQPGAARQWLKYTARVTMWAGRPDIRVLFALRNVNPAVERQEQIAEATVALKLVEPTGMAHYLLGAGQVTFSQISRNETDAIKSSQWHHTVELAQVGPPEAVLSRTHRQFFHLRDFEDAGYRVRHFQPSRRVPTVDVGLRCGGWLDLGGDNGGCHVWLRDFTNDTPKKMSASRDGTIVVHAIPRYDGNRQPFYKAGGYWLGDRSHRTWELNFHFHDKPLAAEADWNAYREQFSCYVAPTAATASAAAAVAERARHPLVLISTPGWYSASGWLWGPVPSLADEARAAQAMGRTKSAPARGFSASGLATEFLHYENFHYRSEWDDPRDSIYEFLRTGEWQYYQRATAFGRNYRDFGVHRTDGLTIGSRATVKQPEADGVIPRWGKFCGCHHYGAGLIDLWLATGDRSYRDAGVEWGYEQAGIAKPYGGFGGRDWGRNRIAVLRTYMVTRDPKLKDWLVAHSRPPVPDEALRADGRGLLAGKHQGSWMTGLCSHAIWHNYQVNRDAYSDLERDDYEDGIIGVARNVAKFWYFPEYNGGPYYIAFDDPKWLNDALRTKFGGPTPGKVYAPGGGAAYTLSCIDMMVRGYLLTGDRKLLEQARLFWDCVNGPDKETAATRLQDFAGMGSASFWARQLIWEFANPRTDQHGPKQIADLKAEPLGGGRVRLSWTAPSDADGMVARYQVKHAPRPIVTFDEFKFPEDHNKKWTWWGAYNVAGEPRPAPPGSAETMVVENIPAGTRYFCIISKDDSSNESGLSNIASCQAE